MRHMLALIQRDRKIPISVLMKSTAESADHCIECEQCDQIGQFQKVLGKKFLTKVAHPQIFGDFLGFLDRHHLKVNTTVDTFWVNF